MSKYIIEDDEVRKYFHQEYDKIDVKVVPGHWPNFKSKKEVDEWIEFMKKMEENFDVLFDEERKYNEFSLKGDKSLLQSESKFVAVIGSRKATKDELRASYILSQRLVNRGYIVVSGLASGIDTEAHKGAMDSGGKTVAIVSTSSEETIYPKENISLSNEIVKSGLIIFPYKNKAIWEKGFGQPQKRLIERDILLAHLCSKIIVVSDREVISGGTAWALNYGNKFYKDIWRVDSKLNFYENPKYEEKEIWWDMELGFDLDFYDL